MADVFQHFTTTDYDFLQLANKSGGNVIVSEYPAHGIVKLRDGMLQADNMEERQATSTVHVRPSEAFIAPLGGNLVGHGIRVTKGDYNEAVYRIVSQVEGYDFDAGEVEFYLVTLKPENLWEESDLSLT